MGESLTPPGDPQAGTRVGGRAAHRLRGRIAVVGLPNTGKSQLFGELTGEYTLVANYPLTTVEVATGHIHLAGNRYEVLDTPGLHSLYIHSEEEIVVRRLLFDEPPDALIQCVDAMRLRQSLPLTLDLLELELPLVVVLNAVDESEAQGLHVNAAAFAGRLGVPVVEHAAGRRRDVEDLKAVLGRLLEAPQHGVLRPSYGAQLEQRLSELLSLLPAGAGNAHFARKKALLLLDGDPLMLRELAGQLDEQESVRIREALRRSRRASRGSSSRELARQRARLAEELARGSITRRPRPPGQAGLEFARLSRHPVLGLPILAAFVAATYLLVVRVAGFIQALLSALIMDPTVRAIDGLLPSGFWNELLIGHYGVLTLGLFNAIVTVLPILSVFFLMMGLLEDIGYLPNLMVLTRRLLGGIGLTGRSVMSLVLGFGCKTMATLTTRSIPSRKERLIAVYLIAFAIPCSAQLAINMAILGRVGVVAFLIALATLAAVELLAGVILNRVLPEDTHSDFVQELPPARVPNLLAVLKKTGYRLYWFLKEALPIFLIASVALFAVDRIGLLGLFKASLRPVVVGWLGLPLDTVEVLILTMARHEAAAGLLLRMVDSGALSYVQSVVAVVITTMFVPCFANIVAMCKELGTRTGLLITLIINVSAFFLAGVLNWALLLLRVGVR
jgi:ferrous iron transport protein B